MYSPFTAIRQRQLLRQSISQLFIVILAFVVSGCFGQSAPDTVRPDLAKDTLIKALTAWKDGSKIDALHTQSPAIVVQDMDWSAGAQLKEFSLQGDGKAVGANLSIEVELTLVDSSGKASKPKVWYLVGTDPALTVFRDMFH